jgi:alcohol dehydrogenase YqhD (iron-dependent ADH family)
MLYIIDHDVDRFYRLAVNVMKVRPNKNDKRGVAIKGIRKLQEFYKSLGMPLTFEDIGAKKEDIPKLVEQLNINKGDTFGGFVKLTMDDARKIYESC